jgi:hypothetical protein
MVEGRLSVMMCGGFMMPGRFVMSRACARVSRSAGFAAFSSNFFVEFVTVRCRSCLTAGTACSSVLLWSPTSGFH